MQGGCLGAAQMHGIEVEVMAWFAEVCGWHDVHYVVCLSPLSYSDAVCEAGVRERREKARGGYGPGPSGRVRPGFTTVRFT